MQFKLNQFEGPLDLLLHLIAKHKMNIFEIEISELLEQYLQYIRAAEEQDMEVASEFLEMAARLVHIKTLSLLPKHEEEEKMRQELTGQLIEYRLCQVAAERLSTLYCGDKLFCRTAIEMEPDPTYRRQHPPELLLEAYQGIESRSKAKAPPPQAIFTPIVTKKIVPVSSRILYVMRHLYRNNRQAFDSFFSGSGERSEMVATFLAILELVKSHRVRVEENEVVLLRGHARDREKTDAQEA